MVVLGQNFKSNSLSSIDHLTNLLEISSFIRISLNDYVVSIIIV